MDILNRPQFLLRCSTNRDAFRGPVKALVPVALRGSFAQTDGNGSLSLLRNRIFFLKATWDPIECRLPFHAAWSILWVSVALSEERSSKYSVCRNIERELDAHLVPDFNAPSIPTTQFFPSNIPPPLFFSADTFFLFFLRFSFFFPPSFSLLSFSPSAFAAFVQPAENTEKRGKRIISDWRNNGSRNHRNYRDYYRCRDIGHPKVASSSTSVPRIYHRVNATVGREERDSESSDKSVASIGQRFP